MSSNELSVYITCLSANARCGYCSFISYAGARGGIYRAYARALIEESKLRRVESAEVKTLYFGGGTPSMLRPMLLSAYWLHY